MTIKAKVVPKQGRTSSIPEHWPAMVKYVRENGWQEAGHAVPTVEGMSCIVGKSRVLMYQWANDYPEVQELLDELSTLQGFTLVNGGLRKEFDSPIVRLMLGKHGYADKQELDHKSSDGSMKPAPAVSVTPEMAAEILKTLNEQI